MKNFVSFSYVIDNKGDPFLTTVFGNTVVDRPIKSIEDVEEVERDLIKKYYVKVNPLLGTELVSLKVITWRPFDE